MGEISTQSPCGFSQTLVIGLIAQWTFEGYVRWLRGLRSQYSHRRDFLVDSLAEEFDLFPAPASAVPGAWAADGQVVAFSAYPRGCAPNEKIRPLLSFVPPSSGMFVWVQLHFGDVPDETDEDGSVLTPEHQFWERLLAAGVLVAPGWIFSPTEDSMPTMGADRQIGHMRLSYTPADVSVVLSRILFARFLIRVGFNMGATDGDDAPRSEDFRTDA
jgi:aromatic amino acid aminotransferase I